MNILRSSVPLAHIGVAASLPASSTHPRSTPPGSRPAPVYSASRPRPHRCRGLGAATLRRHAELRRLPGLSEGGSRRERPRRTPRSTCSLPRRLLAHTRCQRRSVSWRSQGSQTYFQHSTGRGDGRVSRRRSARPAERFRAGCSPSSVRFPSPALAFSRGGSTVTDQVPGQCCNLTGFSLVNGGGGRGNDHSVHPVHFPRSVTSRGAGGNRTPDAAFASVPGQSVAPQVRADSRVTVVDRE